jgi:hypothetical protein
MRSPSWYEVMYDCNKPCIHCNSKDDVRVTLNDMRTKGLFDGCIIIEHFSIDHNGNMLNTTGLRWRGKDME